MLDISRTRSAVLALVICSLATACAGSDSYAISPPVAAVGARKESSSGYGSIFTFAGWNGAGAASPLTYFNGRLYGTTRFGGLYSQGAVFSVTLTGVEKLVYSFRPVYDGTQPMSGLTVFGGTLYGTTFDGSNYNRGTVFSISATGKERVLHYFGQSDGQNPMAALTAFNGALYGTTLQGGDSNNDGTVYSITKAGSERVLHRFGSGKDGFGPVGGLTVENGLLYGTTYGGGAKAAGVIFSMTPTGKEQVLYNFRTATNDGDGPVATMILNDGTFYGTTQSGGAPFYDDGTVFSFTPPKTESVIYNFTGTNRPAFPKGGVVYVNGALYGTTFEGGDLNYGAIFKVSTSGAETVLHSFGSAPDGKTPLAGLTLLKNTLYGTTSAGGGFRNSGTVYKISPGAGTARLSR